MTRVSTTGECDQCGKTYRVWGGLDPGLCPICISTKLMMMGRKRLDKTGRLLRDELEGALSARNVWELRSYICQHCRQCWYWERPDAFAGECPRWDRVEKKNIGIGLMEGYQLPDVASGSGTAEVRGNNRARKKAWRKAGIHTSNYALVPCKSSDVMDIQLHFPEVFSDKRWGSAKLWRPTASEMQRVRKFYDSLPLTVLKLISANTERIPVLSCDVLGLGLALTAPDGRPKIILGGLDGSESIRLRYSDYVSDRELKSDEYIKNTLQHELIHTAMHGVMNKMGKANLKRMMDLSRVRIFYHAMNVGDSYKKSGGKFYDGVIDESMAMVGEQYADGDTVRTLAWKILEYSVVDRTRSNPGRRPTYFRGVRLTRIEAVTYSKMWFTLIDDYLS